MPELPEVELAAVFLRERLLGRSLVVRAAPTGPSGLDDEALTTLRGRTLLAVRRHGKQLALDFQGGLSLLTHLGMTGRLVTLDPLDPLDPLEMDPAWPAHTRLVFDAPAVASVCFVDARRFGRLSIVETLSVTPLGAALGLGPDALVADDAGWRVLLAEHRPVKPLLLDQRLLAGIGNIYACEGLWAAGLSPTVPGSQLDDSGIARLRGGVQAAMQETLRRDAGTPMRYLNEGKVENPFSVYRREKSPCPRCGTVIERFTQAGRSTFYCPLCQPSPGVVEEPRRATSRTQSRGR